MLDTTLQTRLQMLGMDRPTARRLTRDIRDKYHPAAVALLAGAQQRGPLKGLGCMMDGCGCGLGALGITQGTSTALVSTGAKVGGAVAAGSAITTGAAAGTAAFPVVGTVIGAAVGALIAVAIHALGNHDVRVNPADMNMCAGMLQQYAQAAGAAQGAPIGTQMGIDNLEKLNWCIAALYGKPVNNVDYRYFPIGWQQTTGFVQNLVTQAFKAQPGSYVTIPAITGYTTDRKHSNTRPATKVQIPNPLTLQGLAALVTPYMIASCSDGNKAAANCPAFWHNEYAQRMLYDLTGYWVQKLHPEVFAPPAVKVTPAVVAQVAKTVAAKTGTTPSKAITPAVAAAAAATVAAAVASGNTTGLTPAAAVMYDQMASEGVNMNSPQAQQLLDEVQA